MKKIPSVFKRDYEGTRQCFDEVVPGCEWVIAGEGVATIKWDGTSCLVRDGRLFKRYDRKLTKAAHRRKRQGYNGPWAEADVKPAPTGWVPCEPAPNAHTGHWPGWLPVGDGPEDKWHREAWKSVIRDDGTFELVGPRVQGNPYMLEGRHELWRHGSMKIEDLPDRTFKGICAWCVSHAVEGIVFHHPDGRMAKVKRKDFGFAWPVK